MANPAEAVEDVEDASSWFALQGALPGGYRLRIGLLARVWKEGNEHVADQGDLRVHAFGESPADAIENLKDALVEHRSRLEDLEGRLSPRIQAEWEFLKLLIVQNAQS